MRTLLIAAIFFLLYFSGFAQDLVLTQKGDSLNCRITSVDENMIHISLKLNSEEKRIVMSKEQIKYYEFNYYLKPRVTHPISISQKNEDDYAFYNTKPQRKKWLLSLNGGWSYLTASLGDKLPAEFKKYYDELRTGYNLSADGGYFFAKFIGAGLSYSRFRTHNSISPIYIIDTLTKRVLTGEMKDDITISYFGPQLFFRISSASESFHFLPYISLGYLSYKNDGMVVLPLKITGNTIGRKLGFAMDYAIEDNLFFGVDASFTGGIITEYTLESGNTKQVVKLKSEDYSNISRVDLSAGIRFVF